MSVVPQRTVTLVKDLLFQEKYHLSHTQTDLMAYLVNLQYWATSVGEYFVITTSKVMSDLPNMGQKTFEASLKVLKDLGIIETKIVEVTQWKGKPKLRGVKLTEKGKEYNGKLKLPPQDKEVIKLKKHIKELEETISRLTVAQEEKTTPPPKTEPIPKPKIPKKDELDEFIIDMTKHFGTNHKPICNFVPKYQQNTTFYINTYNKLAVLTPQNDFLQVKDPNAIHDFWQWLFLNPDRIGEKIDFDKPLTLKELEKRYINKTIKIEKNKYTIIGFVEEGRGVKIKVRDKNGGENLLKDAITKEYKIFELEYAQDIILKLLSS